jgi:3-phosphoshikimate 1-carboxyvinyltransferase
VASDKINHNIKIATYNDHQNGDGICAISFKVPIVIENAEVVSKSYPDFWEDLKV